MDELRSMDGQNGQGESPLATPSRSTCSNGSGGVSKPPSILSRIDTTDADEILEAIVQVHDEMKAGREDPGSERHLIWPHHRRRLFDRVVAAFCEVTTQKNPDPNCFPWCEAQVLESFTKYRKESTASKKGTKQYLDS